MFSFLFNRTPPKAKFAQLVVKELQKAGAEPPVYDEKEFSLRHEDGITFVSKLYNEYCQADTGRRRIILANLRSLASDKKEDEISREQAVEMAVAVIREQHSSPLAIWNGKSEAETLFQKWFMSQSRIGCHARWFRISQAQCALCNRNTLRNGCSRSRSSSLRDWRS
jgi:hypothetical protein